MRRGLIQWDENELPLDILRRRTDRLRRAMKNADCDAVILYTNFIRCAAVAWLTGFSPYWADGILVVTSDADPLFATTLSKRMGSWIQGVMPNGVVVTSPTPGQLAARQLAEIGARRVGILELPDFPAGLYADLAANVKSDFIDASELFAQARWPADETELKLLRHASGIARNALWRIVPEAFGSAGDLVAAAEKSARMDGAEEVYVAVAPDLDQSQIFLRLSGGAPLGRRFAIRASVAYKGSWIRAIRTLARNPNDDAAIRRADSWFGELTGSAPGGNWADTIPAQIAKLSDATLAGWFAEANAGTRPLTVLDSPSTPRSPIVLTLKVRLGGVPWVGAGLITAA
jgi:hypothetical protein